MNSACTEIFVKEFSNELSLGWGQQINFLWGDQGGIWFEFDFVVKARSVRRELVEALWFENVFEVFEPIWKLFIEGSFRL